jgi:hypothetical protein
MVTNLHEFLTNNNACDEAKEWASNKSWNEIYNTCHRGDWLLWLFKKTNPNDLQAITLAKAHCANTVRYLMKDERSKNAVDVAIAFGNGNATREELNVAYVYADTAAYAAAAYAADAYAAAYAAKIAAAAGAAAADAYAADADAAYAAAAYAAAAYVADAKIKNQLKTADICRQYLPIEIWNILD